MDKNKKDILKGPERDKEKGKSALCVLASLVAETRKTRSSYKTRSKMNSMFGDLNRISLHQTLSIIQIRKSDPAN
ncbi:hypothetical protein VNO80_07800 [Phaseolus coccineus]|uniref:Uncharacterized protein n=1 Tax=Phaseolus coccineus TaxID=3886 RepID=A0AAN9NJR2_PHACN